MATKGWSLTMVGINTNDKIGSKMGHQFDNHFIYLDY